MNRPLYITFVRELAILTPWKIENATERRAKVLSSLTRLPVAVGFPTLAKQVAAIILKPSLAVTISLSELFLKPPKQFIFFTFRKHQIVLLGGGGGYWYSRRR
jgi:hypothetical protein